MYSASLNASTTADRNAEESGSGEFILSDSSGRPWAYRGCHAAMSKILRQVEAASLEKNVHRVH
jgi:hypothetical protein